MRAARLLYLLLASLACTMSACRTSLAPEVAVDSRSSKSGSGPESTPTPAAMTAKPAPEPATAVAPAPVLQPPEAKRPNRDKHGNPDVAQYVTSLQRPERVADLQIDLVIEKLALPEDADVGDLGSGPGLFALAFAKACPQGVVYASDIEPAQLDAVREKIHAANVRNVVPVLASPDDPHFPPGRLDVVFIADTYHHLDDRVAYMQRLVQTLKPGGRLVILEYKPGELAVGPPAEHKLGAGVMEKELIEAGWKRVERFGTHPYHDFEVWRAVQTWEKK